MRETANIMIGILGGLAKALFNFINLLEQQTMTEDKVNESW